MLLGEAWGEQEEKEGAPFVGTSGFILNGMLSTVGINRRETYLTNVFNLRPRPSNDVANLCASKAEGIPGLPALIKGKYVKREYEKELNRLYDEIRRENPNVIVALGATAVWALLRTSGIRAIRGSAAPTHPAVSQILGRPFKVLPTYHPAAVAREWTLRPIVIADLDKAKRESSDATVRRPERSVWIKPNLIDLIEFERLHIVPSHILSIDIETKGDQITCIGFAPSPDIAIVIPFYSAGQRDGNYWRSLEDELAAWNFVRRWCKRPAVFQNGLYDIHFLWRRYGIPVPNAQEDTMLMHHAHQLEMEKGLGFLASIYTDEASWKFMRKTDTIKKED